MCVIMKNTKNKYTIASWECIEEVYGQYYDENYPRTEIVRNYRELFELINNIMPFWEIDNVLTNLILENSEDDYVKEFPFPWTRKFISAMNNQADLCNLWLNDINEELSIEEEGPVTVITYKRMISILEYIYAEKVQKILNNIFYVSIPNIHEIKDDNGNVYDIEYDLNPDFINKLKQEAKEIMNETEDRIMEKALSYVQKVLNGEDYKYHEEDTRMHFTEEDIRGLRNYCHFGWTSEMVEDLLNYQVYRDGWKKVYEKYNCFSWMAEYDFSYDPEFICEDEETLLNEFKKLLSEIGGEWIEEKNHLKFTVNLDKIPDTVFNPIKENPIDWDAELLSMIESSEIISNAAFHNQDVLRMICHKFVWREVDCHEDSPEKIRETFKEFIERSEQCFLNNKKRSNPIACDAVTLAAISYVDNLTLELYYSVALHHPELLEKCNLLWCQERSYRFNPVQDKLFMKMSGTEARWELFRQMGEYAKKCMMG